jgi:putative phosphoesterase
MVERFAVIADIHGNSDALRAVLDDIEQLGPVRTINLGDVFSGPLAAAEVWEILSDRPDILTVRGNHDRYLAEQAPDAMGASDRAAAEQLGQDALEWLRRLPAVATLERLFLCHATPGDDQTYLMERVAPGGEVTLRPEAEIARMIDKADADVILCGHSHQPRTMRVAGRLLVNPGSVGCPAYVDDKPVFHAMESGTPDASYAVIERRAEDWIVAHRHVPYETARMAALARRAGRPEWASGIVTGRIGPKDT